MRVALSNEPVIGRVGRYDRSLERGDCSRDVRHRDRPALARKGAGEHLPVLFVAAETPGQLGRTATHPHLHGMDIRERDENLSLQADHRWIGPGERPPISDIDQTHGVAEVLYPRRADSVRPAVAERQLLFVT